MANLVTRVVSHPKGVLVWDEDAGKHVRAPEGTTITITAVAAENFRDYLSIPAVAEAQAAVRAAEAATAEDDDDDEEDDS